jgi:hypothetical protein
LWSCGILWFSSLGKERQASIPSRKEENVLSIDPLPSMPKWLLTHVEKFGMRSEVSAAANAECPRMRHGWARRV